MDNTDNEIKKALELRCNNCEPSHNLLNSIKIELKEKENNNMKSFKLTPKFLLASAALTIVLASVVIGAGKIAGYSSSSSRMDDIKHYPTVEEVEKAIGFTPKYVESLGEHKYKFANPNNSKAYDDKGNIIKEFKQIDFWYETKNKDAILNLGAQPVIPSEEKDEKDEKIEYSGLVLYYSSSVYKAVPPDYVKTEEDKKLEESGKLMIGFGSDKISEKKTQYISWEEDGISYHIMDMGEEIEKSEFVNMAKQVIDA